MTDRNLLQSVAVGTLLAAAPLLVPETVLAQFVPSQESLSDLYPGKAYSPYAQRSFPSRVFWGDTHLHTGLSMDAGLFGARLGLEEAYRFARGEEVIASSGQPAKLARPLDWLVIADHSDGMGFFNDLADGKPAVIKFAQGKRWYEGLQQGGEASAAAALDLIGTFSQGKIDPQMMAEYSPGGRTYKSIWEKVVDAAERYYEPGRFTTLIGFEWTSLVEGNNLHRNVIFRYGADLPRQQLIRLQCSDLQRDVDVIPRHRRGHQYARGIAYQPGNRHMKPGISDMAIPVTRVASILRYTRQLRSMGAPVERLLRCAGIPAELLNHPAAVLPLEIAFRFGELACRTQGTEHLGLYVGIATSIDDLGPYGRMLQESLTVHDFLRKSMSLHNILITGQRIWLSEHGEELRLNIATVGTSEIAKYQTQLETLVITVGKLREAEGPGWCPSEVSFAYRAREDLPAVDLFAGSRVLRGTGETYLTMPRAMMGLRFPGRGRLSLTDLESPAGRPLPDDLGGLVQLQIESLLPGRALQIDFVAETLAMSTRSLQRALARQGLTYSQILAETRMHKAAHWLENTDKPIAEIAFDLCYTDASNFTRAFRLQTGGPPQTFRDKVKVV